MKSKTYRELPLAIGAITTEASDGHCAVIALINQKGGCGKSSLCFHLAGQFSALGLRVLLVDADPQGSLSQGFEGSESAENLARENTLAALFDEDRFVDSVERLTRVTPIEGVSLVPANQSLAAHNTPEPEQAELRQFYLAELLAERSAYDLVLIDCPPNLYLASWNALVAATHVLVPLNPEDFGAQGLRVVHQAIENARALNPSLVLLGHLLTRFDRRLVIHRTYERELRKLYTDAVFDTVVPEAAAFKVSLCCRQPVNYFSPKSAATASMTALAREILGRVVCIPSDRERVA